MNRYEELKNRFQQEINAFPMKWAFSKEQFDRSMQELGLDPADTDKIIGIPGWRIHPQERQEGVYRTVQPERKSGGSSYRRRRGRFRFRMRHVPVRLANHEYIITYSLEETLDALGYSEEEVAADPSWRMVLRSHGSGTCRKLKRKGGTEHDESAACDLEQLRSGLRA